MEDLAHPLIVIVDDGYPLPLADSRAIAPLFDLDHRLFLDLMMSQKPAIEERDGPIRFVHDDDEHYALLTTEQAYGAMAPIPNTKEARACKQRVGLAFDNAYERLARSGLPDPRTLPAWTRFLEAWYQLCGSQALRLAEIEAYLAASASFVKTLPEPLLADFFSPRPGSSFAIRLGKALAARQGLPLGKQRLTIQRSDDTHRKAARWQVVEGPASGVNE